MSGDGDKVEQFDTLFLSIAQHHPDGASQLLDTFVSFLGRKTDFFIGGQEGQWEKMVMSTFKKYEKISREKHEAEQKEKREKEAAKKAAKAKKETEIAVKPAEITELTDAEAEKLQLEIDAKNKGEASGTSKNGDPPAVADDDEDESEKELLQIGNQATPQKKPRIFDKNEYVTRKNEFLESISLTEQQIEELQLNTVGQSDSPLWKKERTKRLTASNFGKICKLRSTTHCRNTVKSLLYNTFQGNSATNWGKEHEDVAISQFEDILNVDVDDCGLFVDPEKPYLGASPDGLIGRYTIVEVKCPKSCSELTPIHGILNGKIKFAEVVQGKMKLLRNHNYYYQIQGLLHVTRRRMCYFIVWTPLGLEYEKIMKNDEFWSNCCEKQLDNFFENCFLPEIVNPQYPDGDIRDLRMEY